MQNLPEENTKIESNLILPVLAVRGLVFFPGMMLQFDVAEKNPCWPSRNPLRGTG